MKVTSSRSIDLLTQFMGNSSHFQRLTSTKCKFFRLDLQLPFLDQRNGVKGRRKYFMIKLFVSYEDRLELKFVTSELQSGALKTVSHSRANLNGSYGIDCPQECPIFGEPTEQKCYTPT